MGWARSALAGGVMVVGATTLIASVATCSIDQSDIRRPDAAGGRDSAPPKFDLGGLSGDPQDATTPSGPPDATVPFVACTVAAPVDAGPDAEADAGSVCNAPPKPRCVDGTRIARYTPGPCSDGGCAFVVTLGECSQCDSNDAGDRCILVADP